MKPWKSISGIASWLMRLSLVLFIYHRFFGIMLQFDFSQQRFYFAAGFVLFGVLLLIGGFAKQSLTVIAALVLFLLAVLHLVTGFNGITAHLVQWAMVSALCLFFVTNGNK